MKHQPPLSLYLHIPFCRHRCAYCDFNTYTSLGAMKDTYAAALSKEVRQVAGDVVRPAHTLFFGGGTPSLMSAASLTQIVRTVKERFNLAPNSEITIEANPETVDKEYLAAIRAIGINRLSFGVQSADKLDLELLERQHDFETVIQAMEMSRGACFDNINLDLIYGLPGQDLATWERSLHAVLSLEPEHLSLYCLSIEQGTPMHSWLKSGRINEPDPDLAADQYELACQLLTGAGFNHYEISNWALPGRECRHNITYWRNDEYLGMGAGAHGHAAGYRYSVVKQPRVYMRRLGDNIEAQYPWSAAVASKHRLTPSDGMSDTIITQLRLLKEGLDLGAFEEKFGLSLYEVYPDTIEALMEWGLLYEREARLLLTTRGQFLSNQIFYRFM